MAIIKMSFGFCVEFTSYFLSVVRVKRPDIQLDWIEAVISDPIKSSVQVNGRLSFWGNIPDADDRALRVIVLDDGETIHNAYFDRNFRRRQLRGEEPE